MVPILIVRSGLAGIPGKLLGISGSSLVRLALTSDATIPVLPNWKEPVRLRKEVFPANRPENG
ncbi:hypothetical protein AB0J63_11660 [Streptosporangium canum]|uniref:hypothetical protein n=1 Tax=Streptosporangium canum TaxID=324952 RepID=UPI003446BB0B